MGEYFTSESANKTEIEVKSKLFDVFIKRLSGNNIPYARLCLEYSVYFDTQGENKLKEAEKICLSSHESEAYHLLQKIYREKIRIIFQNRSESMLDENLILISELLDKVTFYCQKFSEQPDYIVREYIETEIEINSKLEREPRSRSFLQQDFLLDNIYKRIINMLDVVSEKLPLTSYSTTEKEELYKKLQDFYFSSLNTYRAQHLSDCEKTYRYQKLIDQLRRGRIKAKDPVQSLREELHDISACKAGKKYEEKGKYDEAIAYYKKDCQKESPHYIEAMTRIADIYFVTGHIDNGMTCLEELMINLGEDIRYLPLTLIDFIKRLIEKKDFEKANRYVKIFLNQLKADTISRDDHDSITYVIASYYFLYCSSRNSVERNMAWKKCLKYYNMLDNEDIDDSIYNFIVEYLDKESVCYDEIIKVFERIIAPSYMLFFHNPNSFNNSFSPGRDVCKKILLWSIQKYAGRKDFKKYHVRFLIELARLTDTDSYEDIKTSEKYCTEAQNYYNKYKLKSNFIQNLIYETKATLIYHDEDYAPEEATEFKKLCNYKLLAEQNISVYKRNKRSQVSIWEWAAGEYQSIKNYDMMFFCKLQALEILRPILNQYKFSMFYGADYQALMSSLIDNYIWVNNFDSAYLMIIELYDKAVEYLAKTNGSDDTAETFWNDDTDMDGKNFEDNILNDSNNTEDNMSADDIRKKYWEEEHEKPITVDDIIECFYGIAQYFAEISKFEDAVRTYLITMYLALNPKIDFKRLKRGDDVLIFAFFTDSSILGLLKRGNDISRDIMQLCRIIDELLDQVIDNVIVDPLVYSKDEILECLNPSSVYTNLYRNITTKISKKFQYRDIEFKR